MMSIQHPRQEKIKELRKLVYVGSLLSMACTRRLTITSDEDWYAIWWNGMGRFLLDGRNPQPYGEAIKHFKDMEFGRVSGGVQGTFVQDYRAGSTVQSRQSIHRRNL
jgi:hypothetical protein